jgi:hypothetical protein
MSEEKIVEICSATSEQLVRSIHEACMRIKKNTINFLQRRIVKTSFATEISSIYWAQMSWFHLKTEPESSLWNIVF